MKKRFKIIIPLAVVIAAVVFYLMFNQKSTSDNIVQVSGNIEVTEYRLGFKIPGRMQQRMVDEGDMVSEGQIIACLDPKDQEVALDRAKAGYAFARSRFEELSTGSRPQEKEQALAKVNQARYTLEELEQGSRNQDIKQAKAELKRAGAAARASEVELAQARSDFIRYESLYKDAGVSEQAYEQYKTRFETAQNRQVEAKARVENATQALSLTKEGPRIERIKQAKAALEQAKAVYEMVEEGPRIEAIEQARARMEEAKASMEQARLQLEYTKLNSPTNGVVLTKSAEAGEYLAPGSTVVVVGDLTHPWVRAYINEQDLGRVKLGDRVDVKTDAFKNRIFHGSISFISSQAEFTPKSVQTFEERVKLMFRIKINLENKEKRLRPGMPADGFIKIKEFGDSTS